MSRIQEKYKKDHTQCPHCDSRDIVSEGGIEASGNYQLKQKITCIECFEEWHDIYSLTAIELIEEEEQDDSYVHGDIQGSQRVSTNSFNESIIASRGGKHVTN